MAVSISVFGLFLIGKALFQENQISQTKRLNSMFERVNGLSGESHSVLIKKKKNKFYAHVKY